MNFNPGQVGVRGSLFGFPYTPETSALVILPVPWEVTVSFCDGTAQAPAAIREASTQLDFMLPRYHEPWRFAVAMAPFNREWQKSSAHWRDKAKAVIEVQENGEIPESHTLSAINEACAAFQEEVFDACNHWLAQGKTVATLGGDHSTPLGLLRALSDRQAFGILQIDAHMDFRPGYEGFVYSHASIMHHACQLQGVESLTQVGIRDFSPDEVTAAEQLGAHIFYQEHLAHARWNGANWHMQVAQILETLPQAVYVSLDVDALDPALCPHTGTPVPGGLSYDQLIYLLEQLVDSGRTIIGFDLSESGAAAWDANVSARLLYRLAVATGRSHGQLSLA